MSVTITKTATGTGTALQPAFFYGSAREGMSDFLAAAISPTDRVLMPAFVGWSPREGSGVFDPILQAGLAADFYELNADLTVDLTDLRARLETGDYRVLVLIHYFGRTEPELRLIRAIADQYGVLLVEDLAHGFFSAAGVAAAGRFGHVRMFSLHKLFPFEDGGMVSYADTTLVGSQTSTRPELAARVLSYDWRAIAGLRRENFMTLTRLLQTLPGHGGSFELIWPVLDEGDVPQTLPVRIIGDVRDAIYTGMSEEGYGMVSLYHTLIQQIGDEFDTMHGLSKHIINFPVHQDIAAGAIEEMVDSFSRHLTAAAT
jgi:dTDP-4-amino-4,6-dideoxygalactose transaminase